MSIKDLFSRKTVTVKSAASASVDAESNRFVLRKAEENETFIPPVDFSTASNFIRFGSAEEYYEASVRRIYSEYPYDGSEAEKILYNLSSSYFDRYILEDLYPGSTGYGILNPTGYGTSNLTNGYGLNASSDDYEYIFVGGGVRPSPQKQNDPDADDSQVPLYKKFKYGTFYEEGTNKTSVFEFNALSGSTFEFWMKKNSFDTSSTQKEVILDLWNGNPTSSALYGRITLELDATNEGGAGANPFRFTYQNGRVGVFRQSLASGSFTTSDVADGQWHHWAVSTKTRIDNTTNYLDLKLYKDGIVINKQSIATTSSAGSSTNIGNIPGRLDGYIGALITSPSSSNGAATGQKFAGKLSASLDEVRFWKKRVSSHEIYNNWYHPIGGGANTDKYRETLALYYKFNEGITLTSSIDKTVLDYSGRVANGTWTGYSSLSRNTGSCFVSASVLSHEPLDPIIRSNNNSIKSLIANLKVSGSNYDLNNPAFMYDMVPFWMREEDFEEGDNNLKKIYQILASYFDTLYLQIESLPDIKSKRYFTMDKKPYPFSKQLLEHNGLIVPDLFISQGVLEKFSQRDDQNKKYENDMDDLKKRIYYNIYNNLKTIYESKGTEKSYRNMLRCFGIDDEIVKLNLYTDYGVQYLTDKTKYSSHKTKFLNHNRTENFTGRVYNTSSVGNPRTFISSSGPIGSRREKNLAFTLETDIIVPTKLKVGTLDYFPTDFLTSSIMGFHSASADNAHNFTWYGTDASNLQVHLVRPVNESEDAKFVLTNNAKTIFAETETFKKIYSNERWALGLKVYPNGYPFIGTVATASNPTYTAELYGVSHVLNDIKREFTITASLSYAQGSAMLANTKRFYAGCEATNFTGSAYHYSDIKIAACRLWYDKLENSALKQHNLDASNYGSTKIHGNPMPYVEGLENVHIPSAEALAFNWDFQQITGSDSNGRFVVEDFSSGTSASRYGWIDDLILRENRAGGFGYGTNSTNVVDNEFIFSAKKELPEISFSSDNVFVKGDEETYFAEDEDTTDNVFAFEKSMYQVVSEEILKTFSTVTEYANLFMKPVDHYREEYKRLDHFKELYFERVQSDFDFEKFTNYFKFIDSAISVFIQQLHPAMAKFNEGISDMVESHILERPKYKRQFPFIVTRDTIPSGKMSGVRERIYNWKQGHAPNYRSSFDENDHCFWQKERSENAIVPAGAKLDELRKVIVSEVDGKSKNLGTSDRTIYQGSTYAVRSFSRQYRLTYEEQKTIHGGTNYGHQKNRDFALDHLKPHGAVASNNVPQEVITIGVGPGLGTVGLDKCEVFSDPYLTDDYSARHRDKAEYKFFGIVGRYADGTGDQPKSDQVEELFKVKGHYGLPFNLVSGTISTGYNAKISSSYDNDFILTNLHSDTTSPNNEVPMQGPFAEAWVGGRQFRHVPMNRYDATLVTSGGAGTVNQLDDQFTRPEGYRLLVGDHPSEPVRDGALGMLGPDYGGPYPETTRKMAVHYRVERAKRPFNLKNIQYTTASAILGNFRENYEILHSVGRSENNRRFREFADVSSSLTSPIGAILPQTTNQASLFGGVPLLSGNVFGGTTNITADVNRVRRYARDGVKASGSFYYNDTQYFLGGLRASGSFKISGSTVLDFDKGSFVVSGSARSGSNSQGHFTLAYPSYTKSSGSFTFTGSTIQGVKAEGSVTVGSMPTFTNSTGSFQLSVPTTFGTPASGSITVNSTMPTFSVSSGSFQVTGAFVAATTAVNGAFTLTGRTIYPTQYTGSFELQAPATAAQRGYISFKTRGTTMIDGNSLTASLGGTTKTIQADTNGSTHLSPDITMGTSDIVQALSLNDTLVRDTSFTGFTVGSGIAVSFWIKVPVGEIPQSSVQTLFSCTHSGITTLQAYWGNNNTTLLVYARYSDGTYISPRWNTNIPDDDAWHHVVLTFDGVNSDGTTTGSPNFHLYVDNSQQTRSQTFENLTGAKAASDMNGVSSVSFGDTDFQMSLKDIAIWETYLDSTEVSEIYNSGNYFDYSTHSEASKLVSLYTMSNESDTTSTIQDAQSANNDMTVTNSSNASFVAAPYSGPALTNEQIWDRLQSDLNTEFSGWTATYVSGATEATFYVHKDAAGSSGGSASQSESGSTFTLQSSGNGVNAIGSTLVHGDNITIEGDQFDIFTTTSGSSFPHVNAAAQFRKSIEWPSTSTNQVHFSSNDFEIPSFATDTAISYSGWVHFNSGGSYSDIRSIFSIWDQDNPGSTGDFAFGLYHYQNKLYLRNGNSYQGQVSYTVEADKWVHMTAVMYKNLSTTPKLWINGVSQTVTNWTGTGTMAAPDSIFFGDWFGNTNSYELKGALQDAVIWNTELNTEDANVLYNSGSWFNISSHTKAANIVDWWLLGEESALSSKNVGDNLSTITTISPYVGDHDLTISSNTSVNIKTGTSELYKTDATLFNDLTQSIADNTLYTAGEISYTTSGNTGTFTLTDSLSSAPTAFSNNANQGFKNLSGPSANGDDLANPTGGANDGDTLRIGTKFIIIDSDNSNAGGNYNISSNNVYVYSNASDDNTFWARIATAANAHLTTHTFTHAGSGVFDIDADTAGENGNLVVSVVNGSSFSSPTSVAGGADAISTADGRGIEFQHPSGSLEGSTARKVYISNNLTTKLSGLGGANSFIQDGVWLNTDGSNRRYYVSSTGSSAGSDGNSSLMWQRITASLAHGINTLSGHPGSYNIANLSNGSARIEFTGSYTLTNGHNFTVAKSDQSPTGDQAYTLLDTSVNGFGNPGTTHTTNNFLTVNGKTFEFVYPYNSYAKIDANNVPVRPTGSQADLITTLNATMSANVPDYTGFQIDSSTISFTSSIGGAGFNGDINSTHATNNPLISSFVQTAGGTNETGVGHYYGIRLAYPGGTKTFYTLQTLASGSGTLISNGVLNNGNDYFISSTGSTGAKSNGVKTDYWNRWLAALRHGTNAAAGNQGTWSVVDQSPASYGQFRFTGSHTLTNASDATVTKNDNGGAHGAFLVGSLAGDFKGYGYPTNASYYTSNGNFLVIDSVNFENVYPFNNYQPANGTNIAIKHTGSQSDYVAALNATMSANLSDFEGFQVDGTRISFTASTIGSSHNETISNLFHAMTTTNIVGGANQLGVTNGHYITVGVPGASDTRLIATDNLRGESSANTFVEDGVWKNSGTGFYYLSSTGSAINSNGVQAEWARRVSNAFADAINSRSGASLEGFTIISGSADAYQHFIHFTGSLTASNAHNITFAEPAGNNFLVSGENATGYGYLLNSGNRTTTAQKLTFSNGASADTTFEFTVPYNSYSDSSDVGIRATGSVAAYFNRVSSSLTNTLTNYTILHITDMGSNTRKFTIRANNVGSEFNSDITETGHLVTAISAMSGGHLAYNQFDDNFILFSHSGSKNHLFTLDHDGAQYPITNRTHDIDVKIYNDGGGNKFYLNGELVTGSTYVGTNGKKQADVVLVRGSTYMFTQNTGSGHPVVFHTSPLTGSGIGSEVIALNRVPDVTYFNNASEVAYGSYVPGDGTAGQRDFVRIQVGATTPRRLFYGCGVHPNMGGAIYVIDPTERSFVDTTGTNAQVWDRLSSSLNTEFPRLAITYSDALAADQSAGTDTSDDYLPSVGRALFMITGSTNSGSIDQTNIVVTGSSWSSVNQITGAMTYAGLGVAPGAAINFGWGIHPDTNKRRIKTIGFVGVAGEDPFRGFAPTEDKTQDSLTSVFTGSTIPGTVSTNSAYYLSSSVLWNQVSASIMAIGQYTITSTSSSPDNRWKTFNVAAKYYNTRFNSTGSDVANAHPEEWTTKQGMIITSASVAGGESVGLKVVDDILGGYNPVAQGSAITNSSIEFQIGSGEVIKIRSNISGWRDRTGDPARTIYWEPRTDLTDATAAKTAIRTALSGAFARLTTSSGVLYYTSTINTNPNNSIFVASLTGSDFNFISPATISGSGFYSGSAVTHNGDYLASHYITGGVTFLPTVYYSSRTNINQREQSVLENGDRNKTIITSRFYGGGGPEVMTEAFLDVYAKEKSVYSALPFRNLLVKNDSGEGARQISFLDHYNVAITQSVAASIRVNSHAGRREGLNTLYARHTGRGGVDSKYGSTGQSDYDMSNGNYEPSFHKVHRNIKVVPRLTSDSDTAAVLVEKKNNYYVQTQIPASDYHYSWATSSLGDNYSVRSGRQKVFGYWPKDGVLIRNNKKGEAGSYYATQITASTIESAIVFPTGSEIHGS